MIVKEKGQVAFMGLIVPQKITITHLLFVDDIPIFSYVSICDMETL